MAEIWLGHLRDRSAVDIILLSFQLSRWDLEAGLSPNWVIKCHWQKKLHVQYWTLCIIPIIFYAKMESLLGNTSQSRIQATPSGKISIHKYKGKMHLAIISRQVYSWWEVGSRNRGQHKVGQEENAGREDRRRGSDGGSCLCLPPSDSFPAVPGFLFPPFLSPLKP